MCYRPPSFLQVVRLSGDLGESRGDEALPFGVSARDSERKGGETPNLGQDSGDPEEVAVCSEVCGPVPEVRASFTASGLRSRPEEVAEEDSGSISDRYAP